MNMFSKLILLTFVVSVALVSCQKEISLDYNSITPPSTPSSRLLLSRMVFTYAVDSTVQTFTYDASNRLIASKGTGEAQISPTTTVDNRYDLSITRDAAGRMIKAEKIEPGNGTGIDTGYNNFYYSGAGTNPIYSIYTNNQGVRDSIVYSYSGSRISAMMQYTYDPTSSSYDAYFVDSFKYDAKGNLTNIKGYQIQGSVYDLTQEDNVKYDATMSALQLNNEAILLADFIPFFGPDHFSEIEVTSYISGSPPSTEKQIFTTTALTGSQPEKSSFVTQFNGIPAGISGNVKFYYK